MPQSSITVKDIAEALPLTVLNGGEEAMSRPVRGGYCGDLLSWVMGRAPRDGAWITIMSNVNVAAVAVLADLSCVILAEGVTPDGALLERVKEENIALLQTSGPVFETAGVLCKLLQ